MLPIFSFPWARFNMGAKILELRIGGPCSCPVQNKSKIKLCGCFGLSQGNHEILPETCETPERLQSKLGEGTTHGIHVNMWLHKVELKVNLEQSRLELQHKKQRNIFKMGEK